MKALMIMAAATAAAVAGIGYAVTQDPQLSGGSGKLSLCLTRGGYRSWSLSWYDAEMPYYDLTNNYVVMRPVLLNDDGSIDREGKRWIPRFRHSDLRGVTQARPAMGAVANIILTNSAIAWSMVATNTYTLGGYAPTNIWVDSGPAWTADLPLTTGGQDGDAAAWNAASQTMEWRTQ